MKISPLNHHDGSKSSPSACAGAARKAVLNAGERERLQRSRKQSQSASGGKGKKK